jgi:hypothetical protein
MKTKEFNRIVDLMEELNNAIYEYQDKEDSLITEKVIDLAQLKHEAKELQCSILSAAISLAEAGEAIKWARKCSVTGKGMNEGWYCEDLGTYFKHEADALNFAQEHTYADLECAYADEFIYWTQWEDDSDFEYVQVGEKVFEIY